MAGVLAGVVEEAVVEVAAALVVEVAVASVAIWVSFARRPWPLVSPIGGARMRRFWER